MTEHFNRAMFQILACITKECAATACGSAQLFALETITPLLDAARNESIRPCHLRVKTCETPQAHPILVPSCAVGVQFDGTALINEQKMDID